MLPRRLLPRLLATLLIASLPFAAEAGWPGVPEAYVQEALAAAGRNRGELEAVLEHFKEEGDSFKVTAARFLIANMPGHGYVITRLEDEDGEEIAYDPLAYDDFEQALQALEALEAEHGSLEFKRDRIVLDVETMSSAYLIHHIDEAFAAWKAAREPWRPAFLAFLEHVLPYRGSQEPLDDWIGPLRQRLAPLLADETADDPRSVLKAAHQTVGRRLRFNERYYLHPTDQGFKEMEVSRQGRCEDITNMQTYAARSLALPTAADYTPAWAHRDNNHAWSVLLDRDGRGFAKGNAHAAKVYRKTFSIQRDSLPFLLPEGEEPPNRFMASKFALDVTAQYRDVSNVTLQLDPRAAGGAGFAYACVFNGGVWTAIDWGRIRGGEVTFRDLGRDVLYLPAMYVEGELRAAAYPFVLDEDGTVHELSGGAPTDLITTAVSPQKVSPDTAAVTPISRLATDTTYVLERWTAGEAGWEEIGRIVATEEAPRWQGLTEDTLYWLVAEESRRLERPFTIHDGRQRFW